VSASFAGDAFDQPASAAGETTVFSPLTQGTFAVGDISAIAGAKVTWWSPTWSSANALSGGSAPSAFKGFAAMLSGSDWSAATGSSVGPPTVVPAYLSVAVVDMATKVGSEISGSTTRTAIVRVNPGYDPTAGAPGTGLLVGFLP
jgi:hypothetical protein